MGFPKQACSDPLCFSPPLASQLCGWLLPTAHSDCSNKKRLCPVFPSSVFPWRPTGERGVPPAACSPLCSQQYPLCSSGRGHLPLNPQRLRLGEGASRWCSRTLYAAPLPHIAGQGSPATGTLHGPAFPTLGTAHCSFRRASSSG